jgi:hypothetical protein
VLRRLCLGFTLAISPSAVADPTPDPALAPVPAWQAFATPPVRSTLDRPQPPWTANTSVGLTLDTFDDRTLSGKVVLVAAPGLDASTCAVEIIWDAAGKEGARLVAPPVVIQDPGGQRRGTRGTWQFTTPVMTSRPAVRANAYVFCPLNNAHVDRPWGVTFSTGDTVVAGPRARKVYCSQLKVDNARSIEPKIQERRTVDLSFGCGVLVRRRGRTLVDECRGDVLVALDSLGSGVEAEGVEPAGTPLALEELRSWMAGSTECDRVHLIADPKFGAKGNAAFAGLVRKLGKRLVRATSRDNRIPRHEIDF